jgi:hypothetical protein
MDCVIVGSAVAVGSVIVRCQVAVVDMIVGGMLLRCAVHRMFSLCVHRMFSIVSSGSLSPHQCRRCRPDARRRGGADGDQ